MRIFSSWSSTPASLAGTSVLFVLCLAGAANAAEYDSNLFTDNEAAFSNLHDPEPAQPIDEDLKEETADRANLHDSFRLQEPKPAQTTKLWHRWHVHTPHRHHKHTPTPTHVPTATPTESPTASPTVMPTAVPTQVPTEPPTAGPTRTPTEVPTPAPSFVPSEEPTPNPTHVPTEVPTTLPPTTDEPSHSPSHTPTEAPTEVPTALPTDEPTEVPTTTPTEMPTPTPTRTPTEEPTASPTMAPTTEPTAEPTVAPTADPTVEPTAEPTPAPTTGGIVDGPISCGKTAAFYRRALNAAKKVTVICNTSCTVDVGETDAGWEVYGPPSGPFSDRSSICKAAATAGIFSSHNGGNATLISAGREPKFVPYALFMETTFCFEGLKHCRYPDQKAKKTKKKKVLTRSPTRRPTGTPTAVPTAVPTASPTVAPTEPPTVPPTDVPTTMAPTVLKTLTGYVKNGVNGRGVAGAVVKFTAGPNAGKQAKTSSNGSYRIVLGAGGGLSTIQVSGLAAFEDSTETMRMTTRLARYDVDLSPKLKNGEFRTIFSWGKSPKDMDIWMTTPDPKCTIGFRKKKCKDKFHHVGLDKDDTSGYGPETITIAKQIPGLYKFYVHRYSTTGDLKKSGGIVKVFHKLSKAPFTVTQKSFKIGVDGRIVVGHKYPKPNAGRPLPSWTAPSNNAGNIWSVFAYNSTSHKFATAPNLPALQSWTYSPV